MAQKVEDIIRDNLADRLDLFPEKLSLISKNYHIPKTAAVGSRYIDIFCAKEGRYVIIELKRTNQAARQALHEICKYVEGVMSQKGVKKTEIEAYIVSTEWDELLIPFSVFSKEVGFIVKGYKIVVDNNIPVSLVEVVPVEITEGRFFSEFQDLRMYVDHSTLSDNVFKYIESYKRVGVFDFVLIIFEIPKEYNDYARLQVVETMRQLQENMNIVDDSSFVDLSQKIPDYSYALYGGFKSCSVEYYEELLKKNDNLWDEIQSIREDHDVLELYEENVIYNLRSSTDCDHLEIGYPAKLSQLIASGWVIKEIVRSGCFVHNHILSDNVILSELRGDRGTGGRHYNRKGDICDKSTLAELKDDLTNKIYGDKTWINHINFILSQYESKNSNQCLFDLNFLMPNNFLISIYHQLSSGGIGDDIPLYIPNYCFSITEYEKFNCISKKAYIGYVAFDGRVSSFNDLMNKFYDGDIFKLAFPLVWGGFIENDHEIMEYLGLSYRTCMYAYGSDMNSIDGVYELDNFKFKAIDPTFSFFSHLFSFLGSNKGLIENLMHSMGEIHVGGVIQSKRS